MLFLMALLSYTSPLFLSRSPAYSFFPFFEHFQTIDSSLQGITRTILITMVISTAIRQTRTMMADITQPNQERESKLLARQTKEQTRGKVRLRKAEIGFIMVQSWRQGLKQTQPIMGMNERATEMQVAKKKVWVRAMVSAKARYEQIRKTGYFKILVSWKVMILLSFFSLSWPMRKRRLPITSRRVTQPIVRLISSLISIFCTLTCIFWAMKANKHCWLTATARQKQKLLTNMFRLSLADFIYNPFSPYSLTQNSTFSSFLPLLFFFVYYTGGAFSSCSVVAFAWWQRQIICRMSRISVERRSTPDMTLRLRAISTSQSNLGNLEFDLQKCSQLQEKTWLNPLLNLRYLSELMQGGGFDIPNWAKNEACRGNKSYKPINLYPVIAHTPPMRIPKAASPIKTYWKVFTNTPQFSIMSGSLMPVVLAQTVMGWEQQVCVRLKLKVQLLVVPSKSSVKVTRRVILELELLQVVVIALVFAVVLTPP